MEQATDFTPITALLGGGLIGLASVLLLATNGRIAGVSGIIGALFSPGEPDRLWRIAFVIGLIAAPWIWVLAPGGAPTVQVATSLPLLIAAGLLVGVGTQIGSGCTSGHGVCGLGRLSGRSLVAVLTFMAMAAATVFLMRHVL
ncbi:MAG: YeeE/YedE family protein [Pseudomonadota bacterium]